MGMEYEVNFVKGRFSAQGGDYEITSFTSDFGMNEIPSCTVSLAIGRDANSLQVSQAHILVRTIEFLTPAQVFLQVEIKDGDPVDAWTGSEFMAFDGLVMSSGFRTNFGRAELTITLAHWAVQLNFSSMLSSLYAPGNPMMTAFSASFQPVASGGSSIDSFPDITQGLIKSALSSDFWGKGIFELFKHITQTNYFAFKDNSVKGTNSAAMQALNRFEPANGGNAGVPLSFNSSVMSTTASIRIARQLMAGINFMKNSTFWDILVGDYANNFNFAVIPLVDSAIVVPFMGGIRASGTPFGITPDQYDSFELANALPRPLRGVNLLVSRTFAAGTAPSRQAPQSLPSFLSGSNWDALFESGKDGVMLHRSAPAWIADTIPATGFTLSSALQNNIPTNQTPPTNPTGTAQSIAKAANANEAIPKQDQDLWKAYAHALFVGEILRHRQGRLSGKLRFDMCPGTTVGIISPEDRFVEQQLGSIPLFGTIIRVTTRVMTDPPHASTAFHFGWMRNSTEDSSNNFTIPAHPFWDKPFHGAALIQST